MIDSKVTVYDCIEDILANYKNDGHFSYIQTFQLCSDISVMFRHFSYVQTFQLCSDNAAVILDHLTLQYSYYKYIDGKYKISLHSSGNMSDKLSVFLFPMLVHIFVLFTDNVCILSMFNSCYLSHDLIIKHVTGSYAGPS